MGVRFRHSILPFVGFRANLSRGTPSLFIGGCSPGSADASWFEFKGRLREVCQRDDAVSVGEND